MNELMNTAPAWLPAALLFAVSALVLGAIVYALNKGRMTTDGAKSIATLLDGAQLMLDTLSKMTGAGAVSVAAYVTEAAAKAARAAEQMYTAGQIGKEERNAKAKEYAEQLLHAAGIEMTDDYRTAIAVAIEAECDLMGHAAAVRGYITGTPEEFADLICAEGIDAEALSDSQLRAVCEQAGLISADDAEMTREEMFARMEKHAEESDASPLAKVKAEPLFKLKKE